MLSESKRFCFFFSKDKSLSAHFVCQSWKNRRSNPRKMPGWRPLPCFLVPVDFGVFPLTLCRSITDVLKNHKHGCRGLKNKSCCLVPGNLGSLEWRIFLL